MTEIELKPLTIEWDAWRRIVRSRVYNLDTILKDLSVWQKRADEWINSLTEQQKADLLQLAMAEIDMLFCAVDMTYQPTLEGERLDFRTRFYELQPLVYTCERLEVSNSKRVRQALCDLEDYAIKQKGWLP